MANSTDESFKVQNETATGSSSSSRIRTTLTIKVENIDYDTQACMLRLKGRNIVENDYVKVRYLGHQLTGR
jgi:protein pelota